MRRALFGIVTAAIAAAGLFGAASCVGDGGTETLTCPTEAVFTGRWPDGGAEVGAAVSTYMERRCGTMDCHGAPSRPLRLYGQYGLREPVESNVSGGKPTTLAELKANYASVCNVEPEKTAQAVTDEGQSADQLLVVRKARGIEGHKGGAVVQRNSPGDRCILGWLSGADPAAVGEACAEAIGGL